MKANFFIYRILCTLVACRQANQDDLVTYCEQTNFQQTPHYAETIDYCKRLAAAAASPYAHYTTFGKSPQGRDLPLLIIDKNRRFTPDSVRKTDNVVSCQG